MVAAARNNSTSESSPDRPTEAEERRLQALYEYDVLDTPAEESFDRITRLAQVALQAPMATISLVDRDRQWFKSLQGLATRETKRDVSFCSNTVCADGPFVVEDTLADPRFCNSPLVTGDARIRAYAGVPLRTPSGHNVGALCIMDIKPRAVSKQQIDILRDLARLAIDELELRKLASIDALTGVMTRRAFLAEARREVKRAKRYRRKMACISFDLDHFKSINDTYGHAAGDQVLIGVCALCRRELRASDQVGRLGGEEFAILLPEIGVEAAEVAGNLRKKLFSLSIVHDSQVIGGSASFGVAVLSPVDAGFNDLLARADAALYRAKSLGRNKVVLADADADARHNSCAAQPS